MNRRAPLARRAGATPYTTFRNPGAPLARTSFPASAGPLSRSTRLPGRSKKTMAVYRDRRVPLVQEILAARPWCEIRWGGNCAGLAEGLHEKLSRGRGGSVTDPANCVSACHYCNGAVSDNPAEAEARGWLLPSGRPSKAVAR